MDATQHPFLNHVAEIRRRDPSLSRQQAVAAATRKFPDAHANWLRNMQRTPAKKAAVVAAYM